MANRNLSVELLTGKDTIHEMIYNATFAGLICTDSVGKIGTPGFNEAEFLARRIDDGHESVIEHINLSFMVCGISRACLQELARHRHVSLSVMSTRWTLKKNLMSENGVTRRARHAELDGVFNKRIHAIPSGHDELCEKLTQLRDVISDVFYTAANDENRDAITADVMKYFLPECYTTDLVMTCNLRELRHIYKLRHEAPALEEFQELCAAIRKSLPDNLMVLLIREPVVKQEVQAKVLGDAMGGDNA